MKNKFMRIGLYFVLICTGIIICLYAYLNITSASASTVPELENGDIVLQTSASSQSLAILMASGSPYSHMGIIKKSANKIVVIEGAGPVRETPLQEWIERGLGGRLTISRLKTINTKLGNNIVRNAHIYYGRPYDPYFYFKNDGIYCSELVYNAYKDSGIMLGKIEKIKDLNIDNFAADQLLKQRWKSHPLCQKAKDFENCKEKILEQTLITPQSIAADSKLDIIYSNY